MIKRILRFFKLIVSEKPQHNTLLFFFYFWLKLYQHKWYIVSKARFFNSRLKNCPFSRVLFNYYIFYCKPFSFSFQCHVTMCIMSCWYEYEKKKIFWIKKYTVSIIKKKMVKIGQIPSDHICVKFNLSVSNIISFHLAKHTNRKHYCFVDNVYLMLSRCNRIIIILFRYK
jgi:hypothetical protein